MGIGIDWLDLLEKTNIGGVKWVDAKAVCRTLQLPESAIISLFENEKTLKKAEETSMSRFIRSKRQKSLITEMAAIKLFLESPLPEALRVRHWFTYEVLRDLGEKGSYTLSENVSDTCMSKKEGEVGA